MATGARPVYIDVEHRGFNMNALDLRDKITDRTRAIVVQHTFGIPADMEQILKVAGERDIPIVEDCCHTLSSTYQGNTVGSYGVASFYSFEWGKPVVVGVGGSAMITDGDLRERMLRKYAEHKYPPLAKQIRILCQYFVHHTMYKPKYYWTVRSLFRRLSSMGIAEGNYSNMHDQPVSPDFRLRMSRYHQRLLIAKLTSIDRINAHARWVADQYKALIPESVVVHPKTSPLSSVVYSRYPLVTPNKEQILKKAQAANVEVAGWFATPVHPVRRENWSHVGYEAGSCQNAESLAERVLSLPTHRRVSGKDIERTTRFFSEVST